MELPWQSRGAVEDDGEVVLDQGGPDYGVHGGAVGEPEVPAGGDRAEQEQGFGPGESLADAVPDALPEREKGCPHTGPGVVGGPPAGIEAFGVLVQPRVAVERVRAEHHPASCPERAICPP